MSVGGSLTLSRFVFHLVPILESKQELESILESNRALFNTVADKVKTGFVM